MKTRAGLSRVDVWAIMTQPSRDLLGTGAAMLSTRNCACHRVSGISCVALMTLKPQRLGLSPASGDKYSWAPGPLHPTITHMSHSLE